MTGFLHEQRRYSFLASVGVAPADYYHRQVHHLSITQCQMFILNVSEFNLCQETVEAVPANYDTSTSSSTLQTTSIWRPVDALLTNTRSPGPRPPPGSIGRWRRWASVSSPESTRRPWRTCSCSLPCRSWPGTRSGPSAASTPSLLLTPATPRLGT